MRLNFFYCALLAGMGTAAHAEPLRREQVAPEAKWLIHLDCENLRRTQVGEFLLNKFVVPKANEMSGPLNLNISNILERITSLTAYGAEFSKGADANAVLLVNSDSETQKALEGALVAQILMDTNGPVQKLEGDGPAVYSIGNQLFVSPAKDGPVVISKSQDQIEGARQRLAGHAASLASTKTFSEFPVISNNFLFLGVAEALNVPNPLPAQAKVLQMADGGRVALGEHDQQLFLNLALRGKTPEVTKQIQQVVEGMVALVTLGQPDIPDLMNLAKSTKVSSAGELLSVSLEYPSGQAIAKLTEVMNPKPPAAKPSRGKAKGKSKQKPAPQAEEPAPESEKQAPAQDSPAKPEAAK